MRQKFSITLSQIREGDRDVPNKHRSASKNRWSPQTRNPASKRKYKAVDHQQLQG
jgi:hypothetical protein